MNRFTSCYILLLVVCFVLVFSPLVSASEGSWETLAEMPTERGRLGLAVVNGKIYAIGGRNEAGVLNTTEQYDPVADEWTAKADMPTARSDFGIAVYHDRIYVIGGTTGYGDAVGEHLVTNVTEVYDPTTDSWETKTSMPTPREGLEANVVNHKIYLIGGVAHRNRFPYVSWVTETEVYDPKTDSWTAKASIPNPVSNHASAVVDNRIYIIGGTAPHHKVDLNQVYNPETNTWTEAEPIPTEVRYAGVAVTTGDYAPEKIYIIGGDSTQSPFGVNLTQIYDPENDVWTYGTPMPTPRTRLAAAAVNDLLYAIGGKNGHSSPDYLATNERYTPADYIPEYPSWLPLLVLMVVVTVAAIVYNRKREN